MSDVEDWIQRNVTKLDQDPAVYNHSQRSIAVLQSDIGVVVVPPNGHVPEADYIMEALQEGARQGCVALDQPMIHVSANNAHVYDDRVEYEARWFSAVQELVKDQFHDPRPVDEPFYLHEMPEALKGTQLFIMELLQASDPEGHCAYEMPTERGEGAEKETPPDTNEETLGHLDPAVNIARAGQNSGRSV